MRIGIAGAGALGLLFAAELAAVHDVVLFARTRETAERIATDGVRVDDGGTSRVVAVRAGADPGDLAGSDLVICAVKAYATGEALAPLANVLRPGTLVTSIQNGIDFAADARAVLPRQTIAAGSTTQGAVRAGPAHVLRPNRGTTTFAQAAAAAAGAFAAAGLAARVVDDIETVLWRKLIVNAAINPLGALTARANGAIADDPDLAPLARALAAEAAAVARAEGCPIDDPWEAVESAARATAGNRNSMLQDLEAGRRTEIEQLCGAILARAGRHGIAVPSTAFVTRLVRARERV